MDRGSILVINFLTKLLKSLKCWLLSDKHNDVIVTCYYRTGEKKQTTLFLSNGEQRKKVYTQGGDISKNYMTQVVGCSQ